MKKKLVVLSGAGISAESGIKTYRDNDGLWENYPVEEVASIQGWYRNRPLVLDFYNQRRAQLAGTHPNEAHMLLARMEELFDVTVVTQNVDDLHERGGSSRIIHLHGELTKARPEDIDSDSSARHPEMIVDIGYSNLNMGDCDSRGVQMRPHIVWFGEAVPMMEGAARATAEADIMLIIGTSLNVYPAAGLVVYAPAGIPVYLIDPADVPMFRRDIIHIKEKATAGMRQFYTLLCEKQ